MLYETSGCTLVVHCICEKGHKFHWASSCQINNNDGDKLHEDNLLFAMGVVLSGNNYSKLKQFCKILEMQTISQNTFQMYQWLYNCPGINKFYWRKQVIIVFLQFQKCNLFPGLCTTRIQRWCDSPGSSAKFCSYSLMDSKVLRVEAIDKREVQLQSPNMEREGVKCALNFLLTKLDKSVQIEEIITDASSSVRTTLGRSCM